MTRIFFLILLFFTCQIALAADSDEKAPEKVFVKVDFKNELFNQVDHEKIKEYLIQNNITLLPDNHLWAIVPDKTSRKGNAGGLVLLTKVAKADSKEVTLSFLLMETTTPRPKIIAAPKVVVPYGQKGQVVLAKGNQKIQLDVVATG